MPAANIDSGTPPPRTIEYLSPPAEVSMTDGYFELATLNHFWVRRRFEVFKKLAGNFVGEAREIAEVGCGHGMLQRQIEEAYGREVTGFDLNENGLRHNLSQFSKVCCYDIYKLEPKLKQRFDLIFLWDVLEHIAGEDKFLQALLFHLAPEGKLVVNVPAGQWAFSGYDRAAGHVRRYSSKSLLETARRNHLEATQWSYWGFGLVPLLLIRRLLLARNNDQRHTYSTGFSPRTKMINKIMGLLSACEVIPQKLLGTSVMAVLALRTWAPNTTDAR